jgi:PAS domain S-box-containing protein
MIKKSKSGSSSPAPRRKAQKETPAPTGKRRELSAAEARRLIADLETHRIELELQNEELRQAQQALAESETKYRIVADNTYSWEFWIDPDGRFLYSSPSCLRITGRAPEAFLGDPSLFLRIIHPDDAARVRVHLQERSNERSPCEMEYRIVRSDKTVRWTSHTCQPVFDNEKNFLGTRGSSRDITDQKLAERALRESEERYRVLFERAGDGIFILEAEEERVGHIVAANNAAAEMHGYSVEELRALSIIDLDTPEAAQQAPETIRRILQGERVKRELGHRRKDGSVFPCEISAGLIETGGRKFILAFDRDITERKRTEETLRSAHAELQRRAYEYEAVNRELEAFSYTVSHDLKAPLRSIEGFTRAILEDYADKLDATGRDYLMRVQSGAQRMNQLIEAMLKMARLTRGEIHENRVDLSSLAKVIEHELRAKEPQRRVEFIIAERVRVNGDAEMLRVMLQNLLENAWKFTSRREAATIEFGVTDMDGKAVCFVRDDGAGFDLQFAGKLFMPFKRMHAGSEFPGLGIGLAIAHRIVMRHNGRMWARSAPDKGATFYFTL